MDYKKLNSNLKIKDYAFLIFIIFVNSRIYIEKIVKVPGLVI